MLFYSMLNFGKFFKHRILEYCGLHFSLLWLFGSIHRTCSQTTRFQSILAKQQIKQSWIGLNTHFKHRLVKRSKVVCRTFIPHWNSRETKLCLRGSFRRKLRLVWHFNFLVINLINVFLFFCLYVSGFFQAFMLSLLLLSVVSLSQKNLRDLQLLFNDFPDYQVYLHSK